MPSIADRVKETTTTTGTGTVSLGGAVTGFRAFSSAFASGTEVYYCITDGTNWEVGYGAATTGTPWTLARTTVLASSNAGALVSFGAGTKDVFCTAPAASSVQNWITKTTTYTAATGDSIQANTTSGAWTLTLPATPTANDVVRIADYAGTFAANNLTVGRNGSNIMGLAEDMTISTNNASLTLTYIDVTQGWRIV